MSNTRQPGYYWVKQEENSPWAPLEWDNDVWSVINEFGEQSAADDSEMFKINETRIPSPDEVKPCLIIATINAIGKAAHSELIVDLYNQDLTEQEFIKYMKDCIDKIFICGR